MPKCTRRQSNVPDLTLNMHCIRMYYLVGATLVPVLLGVDETCLSRFGCVAAHPLYVMIGNLPKQLCQAYHKNAYVLVAYLPILESSRNESKKPAFTEAKRKLFHHCMKIVLDCLDETSRRYVLHICQYSLYYSWIYVNIDYHNNICIVVSYGRVLMAIQGNAFL